MKFDEQGREIRGEPNGQTLEPSGGFRNSTAMFGSTEGPEWSLHGA